jgi:hypothetical protein
VVRNSVIGFSPPGRGAVNYVGYQPPLTLNVWPVR